MKTYDLASTLFNQSFNRIWHTRSKIVLAILLSLSLGLMAACKPSSSATPNRDEFDSLLSEKNYAQIKAGKFLMGTPEESEERLPDDIEDRERPQHIVLISKPFELGKYEVTQPQWEAVMGTNPSAFKSQEMPVTNVSWHDVQEFLKRLEPLDDKHTYRLPTEAEWEYACRAGSTGNFTGEDFDPEDELEREREMKKVREKGGARERKEEREKEKKKDERKKGEADSQDAKMKKYYLLLAEKEREFELKFGGPEFTKNLLEMAWYRQNAQNRPHAVGKLKPNAWGLYDMHGNVWEWCQDWYDFNYYKQSPAEDPPGPAGGTGKVNRGGSWQTPAFLARSAVRSYDPPNERNSLIGFRLVRVKKEPK